MRNILMFFFIALPIIAHIEDYYSILIGSTVQSSPSEYESEQGLGSSKFSESLKLISSDSNSSLDICFFLCAGSQADHSLRTPLRSLSRHFAKTTLIHYPTLNSSRPLNVYCLVDPLLANDPSFVKSTIEKFPISARPTQLDSLTWKVELKGL